METVNVLGVNVACLEVEDLLAYVRGWSLESTSHTVSYVNAFCLNVASVDADYRRILQACDLVYSDGISVVWSSRWLRAHPGPPMRKITGADWIDPFCECAVQAGLRVYILAGMPGVARLAASNLLKRYPALKIVGVSDGYFVEQSESSVLHEIAQLHPQVVFVGLGTPLQEKWVQAHCQEMGVPVCWSVGALFDYVAGLERRAPTWMKSLALEWFWRLLMDPLGKWRRYLLGNPLFVYRVLRQKLTRMRAG